MTDVWVLRDIDDHGQPIVAICETEPDAEAAAEEYRAEYPGSTVAVFPVEFWRPTTTIQERSET